MDNQRHVTRRYLHRYPHVSLANSQELLGYLGDLSSHGMMLIAHTALALQSRQQFRIHLPQHKAFNRNPFSLEAEVRWINPYQEQADLFCIGCCFTQLTREDLILIDAIQTQLGFEPGFNPERFHSAD